MVSGPNLRRAAAAVLLVVSITACARRRDPIAIQDGILVLENQTVRKWRNVRITVNDHFNGGTTSLLPGGRLTAPLRDFQTGFGQPFDRGRMSVYKVHVAATDRDGQPVSVHWER